MAAPTGPEIPPAVWRAAVILPTAVASLAVVATWANVVSYEWFHYDLLGITHHVAELDRLREELYLWLAVGCSTLGVAAAYGVVRTQLNVVRHGRAVIGRVVGRAATFYQGMRKVVVAYEVDGRLYEHAESVGAATNRDLGDEVAVYVHPTRPRRVVVVWNG